MTDTAYASRVAVMYGAVFLLYGLHAPYLGVFLEARGLTPSEIGVIVAVPLFIRLIATPLAGHLADRSDNHARLAVALGAIGACAAAGLLLAEGRIAIGIGVAVMLASLQTVLPLVDVIAMRGVRRFAMDYGRVRLWGSLTFIVATFAGGAVIERLGGSAVGTLFFAAALGMTIAALALPQSSGSGGGGQPSAPSAGQIWAGARDLMRDRTLVLFLLGASLVQASHAVYYTFSAAHWVRGGLSGDFVSLLWAIGVVAEIVLFRYSGPVIARVGAAGLLLLGAAGGVLRWAVTAADPAWGVLIWVQPLHALTFGATHLAAIHFIAYRVPDANAGLAQALFATLSTGVVMGLAMLAAGQLYDAFAAGAYFAMAMFAAAGGLCGWMARAQARVART